MTNKYSKTIENFLKFLRDCEQQYSMAQADEQEQEDITQDILHSLELENHDYHEFAKLSKELKEVRKKRREAKDTIAMTDSIVKWIECNKGIIKDMEQLLGKVRRSEKNTENRIYTPKKR